LRRSVGRARARINRPVAVTGPDGGTRPARVAGHAVPQSVVQPLRRRVDNVALRWHARLDSPFADRTLPWLLAGGLFVVLAALSLARLRSLEPSESLARFTQAVRQLHDLGDDRISLVPAQVASPQPLADLDGALAMYPIGWAVGFVPVRPALALLQSAALAVTVLPLWRLARRVANLRVGAAVAVVVAYALFPPLHRINIDGFEPLVLALPLLMSAVHSALAGHRVRLAVAAAAALVCSMQVAIVLIGFGLVLTLTVRRRAGAALLTTGLVAAVAGQTVPWLGAGDEAFLDGGAYPPGTASALEVLVRAVGHPVWAWDHLSEKQALVVIASLLLPVALLPTRSLRHLAPALPLQTAYLLGDLDPDQLLGPLAVPAMPFIFAAATFGLARLGRPGNDRVIVPSRLSGTLVGVAGLFFVLDAAASPYNRPWDWGGRDRFDQVRERFVDIALEQPDTVMVAATSDMTPLLAPHRDVCALPEDRFRCPTSPQLYLVDRELDPAATATPGLEIVEIDADGRFVLLRRRS
jgi:hypothetical protein